MKIKAKVMFKACDLWVGLFFSDTKVRFGLRVSTVYVCVIPMLPIKLTIAWRVKKKSAVKRGRVANG